MADRAGARLAIVWHHGPVTEDALAATQLEDPPRRTHSDLIGLEMRTSVLPRVGSHPIGQGQGARFEPVRVIGRGGLGEVTLARDHDIDRAVAIKRMRGAPSDDQMMRFAHEVRTVGQLEHPNITPVYDVGVDDTGQHYFVMRYVEGQTLEMLIAQLASGDPVALREYTFERRVELFLGVLHAVQYAHSKGIVHRDLKPANIMIGPYGEVMVMDWGIAKQLGVASPALPEVETTEPSARTTGTRAGALVGTPLYMSPEQAIGDNERVDQRSDVYALAVVLYELLTLEHYLLPKVGTVADLLIAIRESDHLKACYVKSEVQAPVPAELSWFIEKGLAKDPAARYQSVDEMLAVLQRLSAGKFPIQCPVTLMKRTGNDAIRFADKDPRIAMVAVAALATLSVLGVVALISWII